MLKKIKMPHQLLIVSQSDYLILIVDISSHTDWQTVQIQISWLLKKPTDLDPNCLQRWGISGFSRKRVKSSILSAQHPYFVISCFSLETLLIEFHLLSCKSVIYLLSPFSFCFFSFLLFKCFFNIFFIPFGYGVCWKKTNMSSRVNSCPLLSCLALKPERAKQICSRRQS